VKGAKNDKTKRRVGLTAVISALMGIFLISYVFQNSYADQHLERLGLKFNSVRA
jgi:hypothetical protein